MQSWGGAIHLLPALPRAWPAGSVRGLRARGACTVDIKWSKGQLVEATVHSDRGGRYLLRHGSQALAIDLRSAERTRIVWRDGELRRG
jgi:alpha-L-fucosidase 2